ncbi:hypothetical protein LWI29_009520 [Acer saccharum]|uniref:Uncharacterized protein n=1 Tax=Acer saccharum TaxID=4024 RepID=A0AA39RYM0_ACESA|nr:hypothetical protein LWI29_009520 [Acer saccharum]
MQNSVDSMEGSRVRLPKQAPQGVCSLNLVGTTLDVTTRQWIGYSSGIGAGVDSFYEYLFKAHDLFGKEDF